MPKPWIVSTTMHAPPERVFEVMCDFEHAADRISAITKVEMHTDGPTRVGTRFTETRIMFGKEATETMEVTALEPGRGYTLEASSHGCKYVSHLRCEPAGEGTKVEFEMHATPLSFGAKVMCILMAPVMKGSVCKAMAKDFEDLRAVVEAPAESAEA